MKLIGRVFAVITVILMLVAFIPLLGWLNWVVIPFAILGLLFSVIGKSKGGTIICCIAIILGMLRLMLGGGIL